MTNITEEDKGAIVDAMKGFMTYTLDIAESSLPRPQFASFRKLVLKDFNERDAEVKQILSFKEKRS